MSAPTAVTVVAGLRGAGKSGVVDRLARALPSGSVVLCDTLDHHEHVDIEVRAVEEEVIAGDRAQASCALRADLLEAVSDLLARRDPPPQVIIEAVAGSDVALIVQSFLRTTRLRRHVRIAGLVAVVDAHAVATAHHAHPEDENAALDQESVAMADLVVVNRLDRLLPAIEQRTAWDIWSRNGLGRLHLDHWRSGDDPLPAQVLALAGYDLDSGDGALRPIPHAGATGLGQPFGPRHTQRQLSAGHRPIRHLRIELEGCLRPDALDGWLGQLHDGVGDDLLRWRGDFAVAGEPRRWVGHGVRTSVQVSDGPPAHEGVSRVELVGRTPPAAHVAEALATCRR